MALLKKARLQLEFGKEFAKEKAKLKLKEFGLETHKKKKGFKTPEGARRKARKLARQKPKKKKKGGFGIQFNPEKIFG